MGSSFTWYAEHGFWTRDSKIALWLFVLCEEIDSGSDRPGWLLEARDEWRLHATEAFTGMVTANLDRFVGADSDRVETLLALSEDARSRLLAFGPVITGADLNALPFDRHAVYSGDVEVDVFMPVADAWIRLLRGELTWDAKSSPVL
ncbi:hypothetical protein Lfu02_80690 [Longispora fulva]|uniref:Uncharacterized protein n=1 Tax=Longispora fulva TaxID=619741 RepID=A0A8J7G9F7_9ACTN|nr:hypothetical protein [Longispora fulva]MBG6136203.1 hypothetical protein [Longispora fulva]GIG63697.1 hypothetical protein Lfu02_80690 [Longispora fulva]